jgi:hypothetical protein
MPISEPKYRNSAGRLLAFFGSVNFGHAILDALPKAFDIEVTGRKSKQQACLIGLRELDRLYQSFVQDMLEVDINNDQRDVLLNGLKGIEGAVHPTALEGTLRAPNDAEKSLLEVCATVLPQEGKLELGDVARIRESISSLRSIVEKSDISATLRTALLELIRLSEDAISRFNSRGARGLKKAFKAMLGEAGELFLVSKKETAPESVVSSSVWSAITKHLQTFDSVASRLLTYQPLIESGTQLFLGGPVP